MTGYWYNAFGIPNLAIGHLLLGLGIKVAGSATAPCSFQIGGAFAF